MALDWKKIEPAGFAAAHLARMTGPQPRHRPRAARRYRTAPYGGWRAAELGGDGARSGAARPGQRKAHAGRVAAAGIEADRVDKPRRPSAHFRQRAAAVELVGR